MKLLYYLGLNERDQQRYLSGVKLVPHESILNAVSGYTGFSEEAMKGKSRKQPIVFARYIAMHMMRNNTRMSLKEIGDMFYRDHTTVIHAVRETDNLIHTDKKFKEVYEQIQQKIYN